MNLLPRFWPQWLASVTVAVLATSMGMTAGWTSPYLAQLTSGETEFQITADEAAWVASLLALGRLFGAVIGALLLEFFGSKTSLVISGLPLVFGWFGIIFASSVMWLYVSRLSSGVGLGMIFSCFPLYMGEISAPSIRGAMVGLVINGMPLGTLIGNVMGPYMSMMWFGIISVVPSILFLVVFPLMPHSPHYLVHKEDMLGAERALRWYWQREDVHSELAAVEKFVKSSASVTLRDRFRQMAEPKNRRAFTITILLFMFMQLSGLNTIVFYMEIILRKAGVTIIAPASVVMMTNTLSITVGWLTLYLVDRCGRKNLLLASSFCVAISMALLGLHFELLQRGIPVEGYQWLPMLSLFLFPMMCCGLVPMPATLLSELFPADLKSFAGLITSLTSAVLAFAASRTYQPLVDVMGDQYVFWTYAGLMVACFVYCLICVPETKGKTLQEIQNMLAGESPDNKEIRPTRYGSVSPEGGIALQQAPNSVLHV